MMGDGKFGLYKLSTMSTDISCTTSKVTSLVKNYYEKLNLSDQIKEIDESKPHENMDCNAYFASSLVQSNNLINAGHYDIDDISCSIATWTEANIGSAYVWYSIMPNTTRNSKKGIAVALSHGVTISWDAHKIFQCSTVKITTLGNTVNGKYHQ